jgi:zinc ribbon protein
MYCPECGKENNQGERFCRACGLSLQTIVNAINQERTSESPQPSIPLLSRAYAFWQNPFVYGLSLVFLGLIFQIIAEKVFDSSRASDIGTIISMLGIGLIGFKGIMLAVMPARRASSKTPLQVESTSQISRSLLDAQLASVTESTTRELDLAEREQRKSRDTQPASD